MYLNLSMVKKKTEVEVIGDNIRHIREQKKMSQKELATAIEVAPTQYSRVETGKVMPSLKTLVKIAKILDVSVDELINGEGNSASEIIIKDKTLFEKVRLIDELPENEKNMVLQIIDLALSKKKFKDLLQQIA